MATKRELTYSRQKKDLDLNPERRTDIEHLDEKQSAHFGSFPALKGYEKTDGVLSYNIICVISGGERKERLFFRELIRQKNLHSLRVAFLSKEGQGLQPYQMQKEWLEIQNTGHVTITGQHFQLDAMDKVYLLSDVDEFYNQLVKIVGKQNDNDIAQWIISNPCFEIWLYYCYMNEPTIDLKSIETLTEDKRSQEMKHLGNKIVHGGLNPLLAFENMNEGIQHSIEHYSEDEHNIPILYATQMHEIAQYLIETINRNANEYNEFVRKKREWRETMSMK